MGEEAPKIKRAAGLGIFQPVTDCKDDSYGRVQDEPQRYRPAQPANEILPEIAMREQPFHGLQPPSSRYRESPRRPCPRKGPRWLCRTLPLRKRTNSSISIKSHQKSLS